MKVTEERRCRLFEIEQYICEVQDKKNGQLRCFPFPRVFRICPGRPAVEITTLVNINADTGEVDVPPETSEMLPKGHPWRDCVPDKTLPARDV